MSHCKDPLCDFEDCVLHDAPTYVGIDAWGEQTPAHMRKPPVPEAPALPDYIELACPHCETLLCCDMDEVKQALASQGLRVMDEPRTFHQAWADKEAEGYQYGPDALEQVRFGWDLAMAEFKKQ